jgi:tRNA (Thr-GGU) A37 N-methylase
MVVGNTYAGHKLTTAVVQVFGTNPQQSTEGLKDFSHVWLLFLFDGNGTDYCPRPRVLPPRLNGAYI